MMLLLLGQLLSEPARPIILAVLTIWALRGNRHAVQSLSLTVPLVYANTGFANDHGLVPVLKWVVLAAASSRLILPRNLSYLQRASWLPSFLAFVVFALVVSIDRSADLTISFLKLISFSSGVLCALTLYRQTGCDSTYWVRWFYTLHCCTVLLSTALYFSAVGFRDKVGFQGIFSQPQSYAVFVVIFTAYVTIYVCTIEEWHIFPTVICVLSWASILMTGCRTAVLAFTIAALPVFFRLFLRKQRFSLLFVSAIVAVASAFTIVILTPHPASRYLTETLTSFITKNRSAAIGVNGDVNVEGLFSSRQTQVARQLQIIKTNWMIGTGFGMGTQSSDRLRQVGGEFGIPISAPTEPGFVHLAAIVQTGVFGAALLMLLLLKVYYPIWRAADYSILTCGLTGLFVNFGEAIFFSIGGLGLYMWLIIGVCLSSANELLKSATIEENKRVRFPLASRTSLSWRVSRSLE